ncbi:MAG: hypothetical protein ACI8TX_000504 [Hyphomicrobiaceae bacterium]
MDRPEDGFLNREDLIGWTKLAVGDVNETERTNGKRRFNARRTLGLAQNAHALECRVKHCVLEI